MSCKEEPNDCYTEAQSFLVAELDWVRQTAKLAAARKGLNGDYAQDIVQEAYLKCGEITNEKWSQTRNHKAYLARIIINLANDMCKKYGNTYALLGDDIQASSPGEAAEAALLIEQSLDNLPMRDQELLELFFQGYSGQEVAKKLGITDQTARKRIWRLRVKLNLLIQGNKASANNRAAGAKRPSLQAFQ